MLDNMGEYNYIYFFREFGEGTKDRNIIFPPDKISASCTSFHADTFRFGVFLQPMQHSSLSTPEIQDAYPSRSLPSSNKPIYSGIPCSVFG